MEPILTPPEGTEVYQAKNATLWIGEDGILRALLRAGVRVSAADARETLTLIPTAQRGRGPVLVDMRGILGMDRGARECYRDPALNEPTTAVGLVIGSPLSRAIGNFFLGLSKMHVPTRLFTLPEEACAWLREYVP